MGNRIFIIREHTFLGGLILLLFAVFWLTFLYMFVLDFLCGDISGEKWMVIVGLLVFGAIGLLFFYVGLYCWFGVMRLRVAYGTFHFFSGVFFVGQRIHVALSEIRELSIVTKEHQVKNRTTLTYFLVLHLENGREKKISFADHYEHARFFQNYLQKRDV